jgi:hypothetical protein
VVFDGLKLLERMTCAKLADTPVMRSGPRAVAVTLRVNASCWRAARNQGGCRAARPVTRSMLTDTLWGGGAILFRLMPEGSSPLATPWRRNLRIRSRPAKFWRPSTTHSVFWRPPLHRTVSPPPDLCT